MYKYLIFLPTILAVGPSEGTYKGSTEVSVMRGFTAIIDMEVNFVPATREAKMKITVSKKPYFGTPRLLYKFDSGKLSEPPTYNYDSQTKLLTLVGKALDDKLEKKGIKINEISVDDNKINLKVDIDYQKTPKFKKSIALQLDYLKNPGEDSDEDSGYESGEDSDEDSGYESGDSGSSNLRQKSTSQLPLSKNII